MLEPKDPYRDYPKYLLADSVEEAEAVFTEHSNMLNGIAYTYSISTGIEKGELFGEAVMFLAKAIKYFDHKKGATFKTYASFVIRRELDEYVRRNIYTVYVPKYIKKANKIISLLKKDLTLIGLSDNQIEKTIYNKDFNRLKAPTKFVDKCKKLIGLLENAAKRAKTNYASLIERSEFIPTDVELTDTNIERKHLSDSYERDLEVALFVDKLKEYMTEVELSICKGIMNDETYADIADKHGKTSPWVHQNLEKLKKKLTKQLQDG